jgi:hypothetical protein
MDKDADLNGRGRSVLTRVSILEEKVRLLSYTIKGLIAVVVGALVTYLFK